MNASVETGEQIPGGSSIESRLAAVQTQIAEAAARAGRGAGDITLVAVSKTHPPESVSAVLAAGQAQQGARLSVEYFGERYPVTVAVAGPTPLFDPQNERIRS